MAKPSSSLNIRLSAGDKAALAKAARAQGTTSSALARSFIIKGLAGPDPVEPPIIVPAAEIAIMLEDAAAAVLLENGGETWLERQ